MTDIASPAVPATAAETARTRTWAAQRLNMVDSQVRPSDITDRRIIRAMGQVPREQFVPPALQSIAYMDNPVPLGRGVGGRTLMEPRLLAKLLQLAELPDTGRVLEVGTGTGYGVAVLAAMGFKAIGVEEAPELAERAGLALAGLSKPANGASAPVLRTGPLTRGAPDDGPFDAIILGGSIAEIPGTLFDQLKAGGRLVAVRGTGANGKATVWTRSGTTFAARDAFDASAAPLLGFVKVAAFAL
jgi:protein-L-isoaspartate(D-aspartate) O-methyltransferase